MGSPISTVTGLCRAIVEGAVDDVIDSYDPASELTVFPEGPRWISRGLDEVARGWQAYARSAISVTAVDWEEGPRLHPGSDLACVSGIVRLTTGAGPVRLRLSWVLARRGDRWRIVHEHGSQPTADPYGTGDWLTQETAP